MWPCCPAVASGEGTGFVSIIPQSSRQAWVPCGFHGSNGALTEGSLPHSADIQAARLVQAGSDHLDLTPEPGCPDWARGCYDPHSADVPPKVCLFTLYPSCV